MIDTRMTNNVRGTEWYECARCGFQYPRASMKVQNGLTLCEGPNTNNCVDEPGVNRTRIGIEPREKPIPPLPQTNEIL